MPSSSPAAPATAPVLQRRRRTAASGPRSLALALTLLCLASGARAEWRRAEVTDPDTGDPLDAVVGASEKGHALLFARDAGGGVRAIFRLPPGDRDFLDAAQPPRLSLDGGPQRQVPLAGAGLTWAAFPVWNGAGEALTGLLRELMQGERMDLTYFLAGGGYKQTSFALAGAAAVLAETFGLRAVVSADELREAASLEEALLGEADRCGGEKGKKRDRCLATLRACVDKVRTAVELRACLADAGQAH